MGCFGYICKGCRTSVRGDCFTGGEKTIMIHVRQGQEMGRVEGHYDEYGRVIEQDNLPEEQKFRGWHSGINGHKEICNSEFDLDDSIYRLENLRVYKGKEVDFPKYVSMLIREEEVRTGNKLQNSPLYNMLSGDRKILLDQQLTMVDLPFEYKVRLALDDLRSDYTTPLKDQFKKLRRAKRDTYSGLVVWHSKCYKEATADKRKDLKPSKSDPNQSWGGVRKKYI